MSDDFLPVVMTTAPSAADADEYEHVVPGVWLLQGLYGDVVQDDATVATTSFDGDRPGGADDAWLDRHGTHYVYTSTWTDGPTYLGSFPSLAEALEVWRPQVIRPGSPVQLTVLVDE